MNLSLYFFWSEIYGRPLLEEFVLCVLGAHIHTLVSTVHQQNQDALLGRGVGNENTVALGSQVTDQQQYWAPARQLLCVEPPGYSHSNQKLLSVENYK